MIARVNEYGYLVTKIDKLSEFAFAYHKAFPWWIILVIVGVAGAGTATYFVIKNKKKEETK